MSCFSPMRVIRSITNAGYSLDWIAKTSGLHKSTVYRIARGERENGIAFTSYRAICDVWELVRGGNPDTTGPQGIDTQGKKTPMASTPKTKQPPRALDDTQDKAAPRASTPRTPRTKQPPRTKQAKKGMARASTKRAKRPFVEIDEKAIRERIRAIFPNTHRTDGPQDKAGTDGKGEGIDSPRALDGTQTDDTQDTQGIDTQGNP